MLLAPRSSSLISAKESEIPSPGSARRAPTAYLGALSRVRGSSAQRWAPRPAVSPPDKQYHTSSSKGRAMSSAVVNGLAGAGGGIIAQIITYPLQTVNTR
ncbi:hypothetical protein ZWY2020_007747 [Hordeum vulgare]|nr:hypothetical protein ZWY2020_007747 [Hordeum vulgare]